MVDHQQSTNAAYSRLANDYSSISSERQEYLDAVDRLVRPYLPGKKILDVGSGDGQRIQQLAKLSRPSSVLCLEPSEGMYELITSKTTLTALKQPAQVFNPDLCTKYDVITCLWNVLGHIPYEDLPATLLNLNAYLVTDGVLVFDINNRHNKSYGRFVGWYRRILDRFFFRPSRGDAAFTKTVNGQSTTLRGHLFTHREVLNLLASAGFQVIRHLTVNYSTGSVSSGLYDGQHFFVATKH